MSSSTAVADLRPIEEIILDFHARIQDEINLVRKQIEASRAARGVGPLHVHRNKSFARKTENVATAFAPSAAVRELANSTTSSSGVLDATSSGGGGIDLSATASFALEQRRDNMLSAERREGWLHTYGKRGLFQSWKKVFVSVGPNDVRWFKQQPRDSPPTEKPADSISLYIESTNSRGSRFKIPAVCFPFITGDDAPKAVESSAKSLPAGALLFGVQYTEKDKLELVVFAAESEEEREDWVVFLTKYVPMYVPPRMMQNSSVKVPRAGAEAPLHQKVVLGGEAPK
eukprot:PhM_4_TR15872/c0_g1_i1/m.84826